VICNLRPVKIIPSRLSGPVLMEPAVYPDERGFFTETYRRESHEQVGIPAADLFIQDNHSRSTKGVVRGMHFHIGQGVAKLVRCSRGRIVDMVVDLRRGSPTYAEWEGFELNDESLRVLYVPVGFAHGFCVLSDVADVLYKQTAYYDPQVGIEWPADLDLIVSARDASAPRLAELADELPFVFGG
jgi:dTDP-4-dehydrorhamnose 3,5-epimerase